VAVYHHPQFGISIRCWMYFPRIEELRVLGNPIRFSIRYFCISVEIYSECTWFSISAGLQGIPEDIEEAACNDGASISVELACDNSDAQTRYHDLVVLLVYRNDPDLRYQLCMVLGDPNKFCGNVVTYLNKFGFQLFSYRILKCRGYHLFQIFLMVNLSTSGFPQNMRLYD
jgi:hypothetical protein